MKYTLLLRQEALIANNLDLIDGAILDVIASLCASQSEKVIQARITKDGVPYTWITYDHIAREVPAAGLNSKGAFTGRIKKLVEAGLIQVVIGARYRAYYRVTKKYENDFVRRVHEDEPTPARVHDGERMRSPGRTPRVHVGEQDPTTIDQTTTIRPVLASEAQIVISAFSEVNPSYRQFERDGRERAAAARLVDVHGVDHVLKRIKVLPKTNAHPFLPTITSPRKLEEKWADLEAGILKQHAKKADSQSDVISLVEKHGLPSNLQG